GKEGRPVLLDLLSTAEPSSRMRGLLAPIVGTEPGEESCEVMLVHRVMKVLEELLRACVQVCAHGCVFLLSPTSANRVARAFGFALAVLDSWWSRPGGEEAILVD